MADNTTNKRYTPEQKNEIVSWVNNYNNEHGRGGVANAAKKFGAAQLSIGNWVRKAGGNTGGKARGNNPESDLYREIATAVEALAAKKEEIKSLEDKVAKLKAKM